MEQEWIKADFKSAGVPKGVDGDRLRFAQEAFSRDLSISLSAFLRTSITASYVDAGETIFGDFLKDDGRSCFSLVLVRPNEHKLLVQLEHSVLFPLIGIALGAKVGSFASPDRRPTEIELQVVSLVVRLILSEAYRAWAPLLKTQLETVTLEFEQTPARVFPARDATFVLRFNLTLGEYTGMLAMVTPASLFAAALTENPPEQAQKPEPNGCIDTAMELMMPAKVAVDVWLDGSEMRLGELLHLREGQIVKLDHPVEGKVVCTLNGSAGFSGQIVSTGSRRAFLVEDR